MAIKPFWTFPRDGFRGVGNGNPSVVDCSSYPFSEGQSRTVLTLPEILALGICFNPVGFTEIVKREDL